MRGYYLLPRVMCTHVEITLVAPRYTNIPLPNSEPDCFYPVEINKRPVPMGSRYKKKQQLAISRQFRPNPNVILRLLAASIKKTHTLSITLK